MEVNELLNRALNEISELRNENKHQQIRLDMYDEMMKLFHTKVPQKGGGMMIPDIVHELKVAIEKGGSNE